jgi:tetratricopeptide (TPR) repeat protein
MRQLCALALIALVGCAGKPVDRRDWLRLRTPHFEIVSALPAAETVRLATDVERFRGAIGWAQGGAVPAPSSPIRVVAFDGRTLVRPFDRRGEPSYFLPVGDGGVVVLRTGGGFRGDATVALRHELAHWILRGAGGPAPPLWIDEGFAQLLSTLEVNDHGFEIGALREDHVRAVRSETWLPVARLLEANPADDWSDRRRFDAQTWLMAHYLLLGQPERAAVNRQLRRFLVLLDRGVSPGRAAELAFDADLDRALQRYARRERFDSLVVSLPEAAPPAPQPLARSEALLELGRLSLLLDRLEQATGYLEASEAEDPEAAATQAALGEASLRMGREDDARAHLQRALATGADDAAVQRQAGRYYLERARATDEPEKRGELLRLARWHDQQSLALSPSASAHAGLAQATLLDGLELRRGVEGARAARALQPASLALQLLLGRLELAAGHRGRARVLARGVWARSHEEAQRETARRLLAASSGAPRSRREGDPAHPQR